MAETVNIRFTLESGDVDFYDEEVLSVNQSTWQANELQESQFVVPAFLEMSDSWYIYTVEFLLKTKTTITKIDQLIDEDDTMTFYYEYKYNPATTDVVMLDPDNVIERYAFGNILKTSKMLTFYETE